MIYIYKGQYYHTLSESLRYECPNFMLIGELFDYAIDLRAMTQGRGTFEIEFANYEEVPTQIAQKIIANYQAGQEA